VEQGKRFNPFKIGVKPENVHRNMRVKMHDLDDEEEISDGDSDEDVSYYFF